MSQFYDIDTYPLYLMDLHIDFETYWTCELSYSPSLGYWLVCEKTQKSYSV